MGRRVFLVVVAAAMAAALMVGLSQAPASTAPEEQPDASCPEHEIVRVYGFSDDDILAQTFTALNTGRLTTVEMPVYDAVHDESPRTGGNLVVEIRTVDASGVPTDTVLDSTSIPASQIGDDTEGQTLAVSFDPGAEVVARKQYAIVLRATEGGAFIWYFPTPSHATPCPGLPYRSADGGESFSLVENGGSDFPFKAFVTPPEPEPDGRCTMEGTRRGDTLVGTPGPDVICGFGGGDVLIGKGGRDVLKGGAGDDALDTVDGVRGNDTADGGRGNDGCATDRRDERTSC